MNYAPPSKVKTICVHCRYYDSGAYTTGVAQCRVELIGVDPVYGYTQFRLCAEKNHGNCPDYVVEPPKPLEEPQLDVVRPNPKSLLTRFLNWVDKITLPGDRQ